jgi:hypothetical protein
MAGGGIAETRSDSALFATLVAKVPALHDATLYLLLGDWFAWVRAPTKISSTLPIKTKHGARPDPMLRYETLMEESHIGRSSDISRSTRPARAEFWKSIPHASLALFYAGVLCLFSAVGFMGLMTTSRLSRVEIFLQVFASRRLRSLVCARLVMVA